MFTFLGGLLTTIVGGAVTVGSSLVPGVGGNTSGGGEDDAVDAVESSPMSWLTDLFGEIGGVATGLIGTVTDVASEALGVGEQAAGSVSNMVSSIGGSLSKAGPGLQDIAVAYGIHKRPGVYLKAMQQRERLTQEIALRKAGGSGVLGLGPNASKYLLWGALGVGGLMLVKTVTK